MPQFYGPSPFTGENQGKFLELLASLDPLGVLGAVTPMKIAPGLKAVTSPEAYKVLDRILTRKSWEVGDILYGAEDMNAARRIASEVLEAVGKSDHPDKRYIKSVLENALAETKLRKQADARAFRRESRSGLPLPPLTQEGPVPRGYGPWWWE